MFFNNKHQIIIFVSVLAMVAVFGAVVYLPIHKKANEVRSQREILELMINDASMKAEQLQQLARQLEMMRFETKLNQSYIPEELQLGQFLQTIASLMNQYSLQEQFVKPGQERKIEQLYCVPIDIRCKGRLSQMYEFFKSLQTLERIVRIENVTFSNSPDLNGQLSMETKAVIFFKGAKVKS